MDSAIFTRNFVAKWQEASRWLANRQDELPWLMVAVEGSLLNEKAD